MDTIILFLILVTGYGVYQIIKQIIEQRKHIDDETIDAYLRGEIKKNTDESRKVTAHLGICEACRKKMVNNG